MKSTSSKILGHILNILNIKNLPIDNIGDNNYKPPKKLYSRIKIREIRIKGRSVFYLSPKDSGNKTRILYLHGGAYTHNFKILHWLFFEKIIQATGCTIIAPDYPLAPKYTYKDSFDLAVPLYKKIISKVGSQNLILMGDSSGGGFALALSQKLLEMKIENAKQIILLSPWLDVTLKNEEIINLEPKDPLLNAEKLKQAGELYAGGDDPRNYMLSPINGPIQNLAKISIFIGTNDILLADAKKLKMKADENNVEINYFEYDEMIHVWMLLGLPESKKAVDQIVELIKNN